MTDRFTLASTVSSAMRLFLAIAASLLFILFGISTVAAIHLGFIYAAFLASLLALAMGLIAYRAVFSSSDRSWNSVIEGRQECPCCCYPTLKKSRQSQFCRLCSWELTGQEHKGIAALPGKTNGGFSLLEARQNFELHRDVYPPRKDMNALGIDPRIEYERKGKLMAAFDEWRESEGLERLKAEKRILGLEAQLEAGVIEFADALSNAMASKDT